MKKLILIVIVGFLLADFISADVISINSGGDSQLCVNSGGNIENCFFCMPTTCSRLGYSCGSWNDGCGNTLNCGSCSSGYTCSSGACTVISGGGDTGGGGGGGGGGAITVKVEELKIVPDTITLASDTDKTLSAKLSLTNLKDSGLEVSVSVSKTISDIVSVSESSLTLNPNEKRDLVLQVKSPPDAGIYVGRIVFKTQRATTEVPFILNVRSGLSLFDISLDIADKDKILRVGEKLKGQINLLQAGVQEKVDVSLNYIVKDFDDNIYLEESETIMVYQQKTYEHEFNTQNLPPGDYVIGAEVVYSGGVATASYPFKVVETKIPTISWVYIALIFALLIVAIFVVLILNYYKRQNLKYKKNQFKKRGKNEL